MKLTKRAIDALPLPATGDKVVFDDELSGFGVRISPTGRKTFVVQYRNGHRSSRRITFAKYGETTAEEARKVAAKLLAQARLGDDPAAVKAEARRDSTVAELCALYLEAATTLPLARKGRPKKASTLAIDRSNITRHILPLLGRRRVRQVTKADIDRFQQDVALGKTATDERTGLRGRAIVKGGKGIASRCVALLGGIFSFAVRRGLRPDNPVKGIQLYKAEQRERLLSAEELEALGGALASGNDNPIAVAAIKLLLFTGARKNEIVTAKWDYVDFERGMLRLPDSKTGRKYVPLAAPAIEVLASLPRIAGNPYIIAGENGGHFVGLQKAWERIRRRGGLTDLRIHDLRHCFASFGVAGGDSLYLIGKVLGHTQARTTEKYAHLAADPVKAVADRTARGLAALVNPGGSGGEVVSLRRRTP